MKSVATLPGKRVQRSSAGRAIMVAFDMLGRRGTLRVLWELRSGLPMTFRALQSAAELPPSTLNTRLRELREADLVDSEDGYRLSDQGRLLLPALEPLQSWAGSWSKHLAKANR